MNIPNVFNSAMLEVAAAVRDAGGEMRLAGGAVRDLILGRTPKDYDFATTLRPGEVIAVATYNGMKCRYTDNSLKHGTVTVTNRGQSFELTTLRVDQKCDGRHADVEFTTDWQVDASRRDFTFNAMFIDMDGEVYDFFGGYDDLILYNPPRVRFVGDAGERIREDHLRILRYFRFMGKVESTDMDPDIRDAIDETAHGLSCKVAGERVWMEMSQILSGWNPQGILSLMFRAHVLEHVGLPRVLDFHHVGVVSKLTRNPITRLVAGFKDRENPLVLMDLEDTLKKRWKVSGDDLKLAKFLLAEQSVGFGYLKDYQRMVFLHGVDTAWVKELAALFGQEEILTLLHRWTPLKLPVDGRDLIKMGLKPGPKVGEVLQVLREHWMRRNFEDDRAQLLGWAEQIIARFHS